MSNLRRDKNSAVYEYELILNNLKDKQFVLTTYNNYLASLKNTEEYKKLSLTEKKDFDNKYTATEEIVNSRNVIVLRFKSKEDADTFIEQLKQQGIQFTVQKRENKADKVDNHQQEEYKPPTRRI